MMGEEVFVLFVKPARDEENSSLLSKAFETLTASDYNFKHKWVTQEECLSVKNRGKQMYIFDPFAGEAFQHLKQLNCRIYGPLCLLSCLTHGVELPYSKRGPVYNLAMKGVRICFTSIEKSQRDEITKKVYLMAGEMDNNLTMDVTHVIAGEVGSNKYMVALDNGKTVMVKEWVEKVWEMSQTRHVSASDEIFDKYKCPLFLGLTIVVSGYGNSERDQIKNFVVKGGGKYSGELKINDCTHLIIKNPKGAKFEAARQWKIPILKDKWLYDCMDKGRFLDPQPYLFGSKGDGNKNVKTSTPERRSVFGPQISDISAISNVGQDQSAFNAVDDTVNLTRLKQGDQTHRISNVSETRMMTTFGGQDSTLASPDVFLDDCRIYLSGLRLPEEEMLRKQIVTAGALRVTELTEDVTHVVIGEVVPSDITAIRKLEECPFVVRSEWLIDCLQQNVHVDEIKYQRSDLGLKLPVTRKAEAEKQGEKKAVPPPKHEDKEGTRKSGEKQPPNLSEIETPSDLEMVELLSQYMPEEGGGGNVEKDAAPNANVTLTTAVATEAAEPDIQEEEALTQDPDEAQSKGLFAGKVFIILGFDEDEASELGHYIQEEGGQVVTYGQKQKVVDIAIVPLMGYPVDVTVSEVLTNAWLQMCIESETLIPYDNHWLARPIDLPQDEPLVNCCICVSGYVGVERDSIVHLCQALGAVCQDNFARKANKDVQASTHLIVNQQSGSKYNAAKKWKIPAVAIEWLLACIKSDTCLPPEEYHIDVLEERKAKQLSTNTTEESDTSRKGSTSTSVKSFTSDQSKSSTRSSSSTSSSVTPLPGARLKDTVQVDADMNQPTVEAAVPSSSAESTDPNNKQPDMLRTFVNPMAEAMSKLATTPVNNHGITESEEEAKALRKSACRPNQSENITAGSLKTPVDRARQKWGQSSMEDSAFGSPNAETPNTFLKPGFRPKFRDNIDALVGEPTPETDLNKSTPLGEVFSRQIRIAAQNAAALAATRPLQGVVIAVAKKLGRDHEQYNSIVVELGGDYSWQQGGHVTHFVFQGRTNDQNKEFRTAKAEGKLIVSPYWLFACKEQNCRVDESLFPHNYNPNLKLTMTPSTKGTPSRSTRATAKSKGILATPKADALSSRTPRKIAPLLNLQEEARREAQAEEKSKESDFSELKESMRKPSSDCSSTSTNNESTTSGAGEHVQEDDEEEEKDLDKNEEAVETPESKGAESTDKSKNQEMKEALTETLGNVLAQSSNSRSKRRVKRRGKGLNNFSEPEDNISDASLGRTASPWASKGEDNGGQDPPQSIQVTWDDPTGRLEEEKLAHRLARVCDPSQNTEDQLAEMDLPTAYTSLTKVNDASSKVENYRSPTPEPPSLAFPVAKPVRSVMSPQPVELLSEESSDSHHGVMNKSPPIFLVSGMSVEERVDYSALIEQLGGKVLEKSNFDPACTHLIVGQPSRNEKFLSCVASGKWVLHKSYIEACRKESRFVKEETHEWGSEFTLPLAQNMTVQANKLAAAAHKWRKKTFAMKRKQMSGCGAFNGWRVLLCLDKTKQDNFQRLLEAGGAQVTVIRPPLSERVEGSHAFLDLAKVKVPQEDLEKLIGAGIHCLKAEYIPSFLTDDPPPDPSAFYPAEIVALKACMPEPSVRRKRRHTSGDSNSSSRKSSRT